MNDLERAVILRTQLSELITEYKRMIADAQRYGEDWSDHQWEAYHFNQECLQERIEFLEEQLANLG